MSKLFQYGGIVASIVLIAFGAGSIVTGFNGRDRVHNDLAREQIVGTPDSSIPNQLVNNGTKAEAFAKVMRKHTLEATGGQTYSQMGRYMGKNGKPTNDEKLAAVDPKSGQPVDNPLRNLWVTETALTTALHSSYFAESVATFAIVMGFALMLTGGGFLVLTLRVLRVFGKEEDRRPSLRSRRAGSPSRADLPLAGAMSGVHRSPRPAGASALPWFSARARVVAPDGTSALAGKDRIHRISQRPRFCKRLDRVTPASLTTRRGAHHVQDHHRRHRRPRGRSRRARPRRLAAAASSPATSSPCTPLRSTTTSAAGADGEYEKVIHDRAVEVAREEVERAGVSARAFVVADGSPGRALHRAATDHDADLIVVGSAHRGRVGRVLAGDVAAGTLHGAPCPVLVAPRGHGEHGGELRTIGVGFDGSPESQAALEFAHQIAAAVGARLRVIDVVVPPDARRTLPGLPPGLGRARAHPPRGGRGAARRCARRPRRHRHRRPPVRRPRPRAGRRGP